MIQIQETTNYDKFKTIRGNRPVNRVHLKKLVKSISETNLLGANPIMVNEKFQILNGQHRLMACRELGIPVTYVIVPSGSIAEVQLLNTNVRNWNMQDFLKSYIERGFEDYKKLQEFTDNTGLSLATGLFLFSGGLVKSRKGNDYVTAFKEGDFKARYSEYAYLMADRINELSKYSDSNAQKDRNFVMALARLYRSDISHDKLIKKLVESKVRIIRLGTCRQYIRLLEDITSYKAKSPIRII